MRKPNYRFERAERDRAKKARKDEKLQRQQDKAARRADDAAPEPTAENELREADRRPPVSHSDAAALSRHRLRAGRAGHETTHGLGLP